jgi:hypothetical protein
MERPWAEEHYRGHIVLVTAEEWRPGCWGWSYVIDGRVSRTSSRTSVLFNASAALRQGTAAARAEIDRMERGRVP